MPAVQVDLCEALIAIGACREAVERIRAMGLLHASQVWRAVRGGHRSWLRTRLGLGRPSLDTLRTALIAELGGDWVWGPRAAWGDWSTATNGHLAPTENNHNFPGYSAARRNKALARTREALRRAGRLS